MWRFFFILFICLLLTACGFQLRGQSDDVVSSLRSIYIQTPDPYGPLTKTMRSVFKAEGVSIASDAKSAPYILAVKRGETSIQSIGYGFSNQVSMNTVTYSFSYSLWSQQNTPLIPWRTVATISNFTINTNQALMGTVIPGYLLADMRRNVVNQMIDQLNAWKLNENQARSTR